MAFVPCGDGPAGRPDAGAPAAPGRKRAQAQACPAAPARPTAVVPIPSRRNRQPGWASGPRAKTPTENGHKWSTARRPARLWPRPFHTRSPETGPHLLQRLFQSEV